MVGPGSTALAADVSRPGPGKAAWMSSKVVTEVSDNKANATSPSHCPRLQVADRELFQGNNLPPDQKQKAQERNWEQFKDKFGVYPEDYRKQQIDIESGG